jgi:hypothetical protein
MCQQAMARQLYQQAVMFMAHETVTLARLPF